MSLHSEIKQILLQIQQGQIPITPRPPQLRVSSLPFCPIIHVLDTIKPETQVDFSSSFYFSVGHSLHSLWQEAAQHIIPDQIIGDWACTHKLQEKTTDNKTLISKCNRVIKFCSATEAKRHRCLHTDRVSKAECHAAQRYQELEYFHGNKDNASELSGHTDFIYRDKRGHYHLIDFKTTSTFLFDKPDIAIKQGYYPNKKYNEQLESYIVLIERRHKIRIKSYTIAYISRDRAVHTQKKKALHCFTYEVTNLIRKKRRKLIKTYQNQHHIAQKWLKEPSKLRDTEELWNCRPCHNKKQYLEKMKIAFFNDCPFLDKCMSGKLKNKLKKLAKEI